MGESVPEGDTQVENTYAEVSDIKVKHLVRQREHSKREGADSFANMFLMETIASQDAAIVSLKLAIASPISDLKIRKRSHHWDFGAVGGKLISLSGNAIPIPIRNVAGSRLGGIVVYFNSSQSVPKGDDEHIITQTVDKFMPRSNRVGVLIGHLSPHKDTYVLKLNTDSSTDVSDHPSIINAPPFGKETPKVYLFAVNVDKSIGSVAFRDSTSIGDAVIEQITQVPNTGPGLTLFFTRAPRPGDQA